MGYVMGTPTMAFDYLGIGGFGQQSLFRSWLIDSCTKKNPNVF
jgi:hypothetical protein